MEKKITESNLSLMYPFLKKKKRGAKKKAAVSTTLPVVSGEIRA